MKRLPTWLAGGPEVSDTTYGVAQAILNDCGRTILELADVLQVDEADVLRSLAELKTVGAMMVPEAEPTRG